MTRRRALLAGVYLMILGMAAALICKLAPSADPLDPELRTLLEEPAQNDPDQKSAFFCALEALAKRQETNLAKTFGVRVGQGHAVKIQEGASTYVVAIIYGYRYANPIADKHILILFNHEGKLLDHMSCAWHWIHYSDDLGDLVTEAPSAPQEDGAQLVSYYVPGNDKKALTVWGCQWSILIRNLSLIGPKRIGRLFSRKVEDFAELQ